MMASNALIDTRTLKGVTRKRLVMIGSRLIETGELRCATRNLPGKARNVLITISNVQVLAATRRCRPATGST